MRQEKGVFLVKTSEERELERRVNERKRELMENYRAQMEEKREFEASMRAQKVETPWNNDREEEDYSSAGKRRRDEEGTEGRTVQSLNSTPEEKTPSEQPGVKVKRTSSFRLNAGDEPRFPQFQVTLSHQKPKCQL